MESSSGEPSNHDVQHELADLKRRVNALEELLGVTTPPHPSEPAILVNTRTEALDVPETVADSPPPGRPSREKPTDLESRIGAQIFNRVGIFAVLAGAAWFLKLAIDRAWVGPPLRVAIGLVVAIGIAFWSERFRRGGFVAFSYTLKALAAGIAYLSLWAAFNIYHLLPAPVVFAAMVAVTVTNALLAWRQSSELLAVLALAGGLATPALLSTGGDQELFLFAYLLLLDFGALALTAVRPWPRLVLGAFAGTTVYYGFWRLRYAAPEDLALSGIFLALFFLVFTAAPLLALWRRRSATRPTGPANLTFLPIAVGVCAILEIENLLGDSPSSSGIPWFIAGLALVYLALVVAAKFLFSTVSESEPGFAETRVAAERLRSVHLCMASGLFAVATLVKFHGSGLPILWTLEMLILALASVRLEGHALAKTLRACALAMLLLSLFALLLLSVYDPRPRGTSAFANEHFATYLLGAAAFGVVVAISRSRIGPGPIDPDRSANAALHDPVDWRALGGAAVIAFNILLLTAVVLQINLYWRQEVDAATGFAGVLHRPAYVDFAHSAWFMLYGAALMAIGFVKRSASLRWQALILLSLSIAKVFLFDVSRLNEGFRVLSFLGLGVLLLAISFAYQRDWLVLRRSG
jgi:uncharacterized membrane protein